MPGVLHHRFQYYKDFDTKVIALNNQIMQLVVVFGAQRQVPDEDLTA